MGYESKRGILLASFLTTNSEDIVMEEVQKIVDQLELTNNMIYKLLKEVLVN